MNPDKMRKYLIAWEESDREKRDAWHNKQLGNQPERWTWIKDTGRNGCKHLALICNGIKIIEVPKMTDDQNWEEYKSNIIRMVGVEN